MNRIEYCGHSHHPMEPFHTDVESFIQNIRGVLDKGETAYLIMEPGDATHYEMFIFEGPKCCVIGMLEGLNPWTIKLGSDKPSPVPAYITEKAGRREYPLNHCTLSLACEIVRRVFRSHEEVLFDFVTARPITPGPNRDNG